MRSARGRISVPSACPPRTSGSGIIWSASRYRSTLSAWIRTTCCPILGSVTLADCSLPSFASSSTRRVLRFRRTPASSFEIHSIVIVFNVTRRVCETRVAVADLHPEDKALPQGERYINR